MYRIGDDWIPLKKGDYVFMDCYCPQACYGVGKEEDLIYIYSKRLQQGRTALGSTD